MVRLLFSDKSGSENGSELGSVNINLDQHARQDQMARVARATNRDYLLNMNKDFREAFFLIVDISCN